MVQGRLCSENRISTLSFNHNCFDMIRYFAAFSVMCLHYTGYSLMLCNNATSFMTILRAIVDFFPGVVVLFSLSGYLVSASAERSQSRKTFLRKRVLRMYPELWLSTFVNLLVFSILASPLPWKQILVWLFTQFFGIANTPACLKGFATGSVNGALWTIFTEIQLYICLCLFSSILKKLSNIQWGVLLLVTLICNFVCNYLSASASGMINKIIERSILPYAIWFLIGSFLYYHSNVILYLKKYFSVLLMVYTIFHFLPFNIPGYYTDIITSLLCPVIVILSGYVLPAKRLSCDLSYGMFLYHWIILNIIVYFNLWNQIPWFICFLLFLATTLLLSWISHHLIKMFYRKAGKVS